MPVGRLPRLAGTCGGFCTACPTHVLRSLAIVRVACPEVERYASMDPKVEPLPCPPCLYQRRHHLRAQVAKDARDFWSMVTTTALRAAHFAEDNIEQVQIAIIADRVAEMVRRGDAKLADDLRELLKPESMVGDVPARLKADASTLFTVVDYEWFGVDEIEAAIAATEHEDNKFGASLATFPAGRSLLQAAKTHASVLRSARSIGEPSLHHAR